MDIRNFFGGGGGKKSSAATSQADDKQKQQVKKEETTVKKEQNTASRRSPRRQKKTSTSSSQDNKTPTPERKKAQGARKSPRKAKSENQSAGDDDDDEDVVVTSTTRGRRRLNQTSSKGNTHQTKSETETIDMTDTKQSDSETLHSSPSRRSKSTKAGSHTKTGNSSPKSTTQKSSPRQKKRQHEEAPKKEVDPNDFFQRTSPSKKQKLAPSPESETASNLEKTESTDEVETEHPKEIGASSANTQPQQLAESENYTEEATDEDLRAAAAEALPQTTKSGEALPVGEPNCLAGSTFVITGNLPTLERDEARDLILSYGGRVTTSVSKKTTYLIAGTTLETGQPVEESRKYKDASSREIPIISEVKLLSMIRNSGNSRNSSSPKAVPPALPSSSSSKKKTSSTASKPREYKRSKEETNSSALWVDFHAPQNLGELIGNTGNVRKLQSWLEDWEQIHLKKNKPPPKASMKENPGAKAALLSGPPGIGKSTTARLIARHCGYEPYEMNASDTRNKDAMKTKLAEVCGSTVLSFGQSGQNQQKQRRVIIMDEVDGMGSGDRGGSPELIKTIKNSRTPIICICNDRQKNNVRTLANHCYDLKFQRPVKATIAKRMTQLAQQHGLSVEENAMEYLVESVGNDIRQVLNVLQMWARKSKTMSFAELKSRSGEIDKDSILRITAFDAAANLFNTASGPAAVPFYKRYEQFFVDYDLIPLQVQQAYPHSAKSPSNEKPESKLNRMRQAADAICFSDLISQHIRGQQQWYLLPAMAVANVDAGFRAAGRIGFTGFPEWMGRNSTMNKHTRMLSELGIHMNSRVSGGLRALRLEYLEALRGELLNPLLTEVRMLILKGRDG
eukprot:gb/GECG01008077.1/.p1 GENE.gb/GECG01008077.1/~~gb/GECG01008077.1/.p1  ORF type:complete len:850 (+),score=148.19 gb/GECG01008077.1/:1-2550(+)